jgi:hypothetical protein
MLFFNFPEPRLRKAALPFFEVGYYEASDWQERDEQLPLPLVVPKPFSVCVPCTWLSSRSFDVAASLPLAEIDFPGLAIS